MWRSELLREENYNEYLRLLQDDDYYDVTFDEESGGMSAVHRFHKFDKQLGTYGYRRGDYERTALAVIRNAGHRIVLSSELSVQNVKVCDGYLDDIPMDIKAIEGNGNWSISTKLHQAIKQGAECVVLLFPDKALFSFERINDGLSKYMANLNYLDTHQLSRIIALVENKMAAIWNKKATPIEGWSISEGFRGQNGADPFTIPPSDTKV